MQTGRIYKNKLSPFEQQPPIATKSLARVKSQQGFSQPQYQKSQNVEQMYAFSQREKEGFYPQKTNFTINTINKMYAEENYVNQEQRRTNSQQVLEFQRKMKEHVQKIEKRYQSKIINLQTTLEAKNQIIEQLRSVLKEKQKIISKLQQEAAFDRTSLVNTSRY